MRYAILTIILLAAITPPVGAADAISGRDAAHQHYSQGVGLLYSGDAPGALAEFREALRLRPDLAQARFSPGTALYLNGDVDESVGVGLLQAGRVAEAVPVLLYEAAALSEQAQAQLETLYVSGLDNRLPAHDRRILAYFTAAAGEGLPCPRLILARIYAKGLGVPQDVQKARDLLKHNPREDVQVLLKELSTGEEHAGRGSRWCAARLG